MGTPSPYEKMRLEKAKEGIRTPGRPADPLPVKNVKLKVGWQATKRAARVLMDRHKDEFAELRKAESEYLRTLVDTLYEEGFHEQEELLAEFYRRIK